jgi:hypothetical protein
MMCVCGVDVYDDELRKGECSYEEELEELGNESEKRRGYKVE